MGEDVCLEVVEDVEVLKSASACEVRTETRLFADFRAAPLEALAHF